MGCPVTYVLGGPCTLCPVADHRDDEHPECEECGGTFMPLNEEGVCPDCVHEDALAEAEA